MDDGRILGTTLDYGVIAAYFVGIVAFGTFLGRFTKTTKDFFFGGQRFAWWVVGLSLVATTVGSYSFVKYSAVAYEYGLSSTMTYSNDWMWMPFFLFVWLPIIYYARITSIPEYFERRFDRRVRGLATVLLLVYLVGYVGINFFTIGVALERLIGTPVFLSAAVTGLVAAVYVTAGGQTAVLLTDVVQGVLLLIAGLLVFGLGIAHLGGFDAFWDNLPTAHRLPLNYYNEPSEFNFIGVFWQDAVAQGAFGLFLNQGVIMRFLAAKSVREGRKAVAFNLLFLALLAAVAVSGAGWVGRAMAEAGTDPAVLQPDGWWSDGTAPRGVFVIVAHVLCSPGVFGLVMAALTAALMSTADTLINAISAIAVNDVYRLYLKRDAADRHYLSVARVVSMGAAVAAIAMVPIFMQFDSIYAAHAAFTAAVTPPLAVAVLLGAFWRRYTTRAAWWTILGGAAAVTASFFVPEVITPFAFGVDPGGEGGTAFVYQRALYGLAASAAIGLVATVLTRPTRRPEELVGLVWGTLRESARRFKGGEPNDERVGGRVRLAVQVVAEGAAEGPDGRHVVRVPAAALDRMAARPGDLVYVAHPGWLHGGLRASHAVLGAPWPADGTIALPEALLDEALLRRAPHVRVEKVL